MTSAEPLLMFVVRCSSFVCVVSSFPHLSAFFSSLFAIFLGLDVYLLFCWAHFTHDYLCKNTSMWFLPSAASQSTLLSFSSSSQNSSIWSFIVFVFRDREKCYMPCYICVCVLFLACAPVPGSFVWINYASTSVRMYKFGLFCLKKNRFFHIGHVNVAATKRSVIFSTIFGDNWILIFCQFQWWFFFH